MNKYHFLLRFNACNIVFMKGKKMPTPIYTLFTYKKSEYGENVDLKLGMDTGQWNLKTSQYHRSKTFKIHQNFKRKIVGRTFTQSVSNPLDVLQSDVHFFIILVAIQRWTQWGMGDIELHNLVHPENSYLNWLKK